LPAFDEQLNLDLDVGRVVLGGCCLSEVAPEWRCGNCDHEWNFPAGTSAVPSRRKLPGTKGVARSERKAATPEQIEKLLRFLPLFDKPGRAFVEKWHHNEKTPDGTMMFPFPDYSPDVKNFFRLAAQACWSDLKYEPTVAGAMLRDEDAIGRATMAQIRTMLTYCVRGERFCDGHWEAVLESGRVVALLRRLELLRHKMQ
jgi:hypothetical protein